MGRTNRGRRNNLPFSIIPALGKIPENNIQPSISECCDVLHKDVLGSSQANDSCELEPKAGSRAFFDSLAPSGDGDVLAGKSSADKVDFFDPPDFPDVPVSFDVRPMLLKDSCRVVIYLDLPYGFEVSRSLQPKLDAADPGKEAADRENASSPASPLADSEDELAPRLFALAPQELLELVVLEGDVEGLHAF